MCIVIFQCPSLVFGRYSHLLSDLNEKPSKYVFGHLCVVTDRIPWRNNNVSVWSWRARLCCHHIMQAYTCIYILYNLFGFIYIFVLFVCIWSVVVALRIEDVVLIASLVLCLFGVNLVKERRTHKKDIVGGCCDQQLAHTRFLLASFARREFSIVVTHLS